MALNIKKHTVLQVLFFFIMLIDVRFFYTVSVSNMYELYIAIFMVTFMWLCCKDSDSFPNKYLIYLCLATVAIFVFVFIYTSFNFSQSFSDTLIGESANFKMLLIILIYPLAYISYKKNGVEWLMKLLNFFAAVLYIVAIGQSVIYNTTGQVIFKSLSTTSELPVMNGSLRISLWWFGHLMIVYNFYKFYIADSERKVKGRVVHLLLFLAGAIAALVVSRVRGTIIATVICLIMVVLLKKNTKKGFASKVLLIFIIATVGFGTDIVIDFFSSFSEKAVRGYSTTARLYAIDYYWNYFKEHPLCGFGFANGMKYYSVVHGDGRAAISDVGIFGQLGKYGLMILFIYVIPLIHSFKIILRVWKSPYIKNQIWYLAMAVFILATSFSVIAIDHFRILLWVVYLVVIECINWADIKQIRINE